MDMNDPDPLDELLKTWKVDKTVDLQNGVWRRIAATETTPVPWWTALWGMVDAWLPKPAVALSVCGVFIMTGLGIGQIRRQAEFQKSAQALEQSYWRSVDPFQNVSTSP